MSRNKIARGKNYPYTLLFEIWRLTGYTIAKLMAKGLKRNTLQSLPTFVKNQLKFPEESLAGYFFRYGSAVILAAIALALSIFVPQPAGKTIFFLLFTLATILTIFMSGFLSGMVVVTICIIASYFLIYQFYISPLQLLELGLFCITGIIFGLIVDYVRQINLLKELNRTKKKYYDSITVLEERMYKAEKDILMRDEFLSIASHELKTPLTAMLLQIQIALYNIRNVSLAKFSVQNLLEMLESVENQTKRLSKMINDLLNISLITTGKITIEPEQFNLAETVKDAVEKVPSSMNKNDYPIHLHSREKLIGNWDKVRVEQIVNNLISNAIKYGGNKPIEINLRRKLGNAELVIRDHGIGIPKNEQKRVFARFQRGKNSKKRGGLGVGLYITSQLIKAHKGKITLKSTEGEGSVFTVELPLKAPHGKSH